MKNHLIFIVIISFVGPKKLWPWPIFTLGSKARAEEGICRGQMGKGRNAGGTAEDDLVLDTPRLQREEQPLVEGCPQKAP